MNLDYSIFTHRTNHRPTTTYSHFNEDIHCDNEVNLILEKNRKQSTTEQPNKNLNSKENSSVSINQTNPYYFIPIREQTLTTTIAENHAIDCSSSSSDLHHPSTSNILDESSSANYFSTFTSIMNSLSDATTVNSLNQTNYSLNDMELTKLFISSFVDSTPSPPTVPSSTMFDNANHNGTDMNDNQETSTNKFDDVFSNPVTDLDFDPSSPFINSQSTTIGPPPGFENFRFDSSLTNGLLSTTTNNPTNSSTINTAVETAVSSSDTINFSQLLSSTEVDLTQLQQAPMAGRVGSIRSSSSSHPSFASDEQSMFFPTKNHPYSPSNSMFHASSQIFSNTTPPGTSTINATNSVANLPMPNSLSYNNHHPRQVSSSSSSSLSRMPSSANDSPLPKTSFDTDTKLIDGEMTPNRIFTPTNSFFTNGHTDFNPSKAVNKKNSSVNQTSSITVRTSSSSSSSSSNDEALIHLTKNQQKHVPMNNLFTDESNSIFNFHNLQVDSNIDEEQQQAVHENISFLASMASASTPITSDMPWSLNDGLHSTNSTALDLNKSLPRKQTNNNFFRRQLSHQPITHSHMTNSNTLTLQELIENLNESCYKGFDELHNLIQQQRCVQSALNLPSTSISSGNSPILTSSGSNSGSSRVLVVSEYFIFKCKKVEGTASHVFEILLNNCPEYRLRDRLGTFKSWKEAILNAESIHKDEENKLRLSTEHPHSYYMTDAVLRSTFDRVCSSIRLLATLTQQVGQIFQFIVMHSSQQGTRQSTSDSTSNVQQMSGSMTTHTKTPYFLRNSNGLIRSTP